ncbi:uncharacterized protein K444DRAFT_431779 [Hyaloscypha bicolor E]|uniref:Uncharacterized protein n=1 Tax=Hyaloscypha bicolor E TaxID=1095630 RepID=A0A2J6T5V2_9HELO|nr:uncharacterized protein K444DRAFT_431779 [Hyaloscypha bicolor E]PMD58394.1 hypothetical protein K444DRAFT_431779 [Hyaloscypha bicolor E]
MSFPTPRHPFSTASINHLSSKSLKPQIVRTQPKSGETSLSWRTHPSIPPIPKGPLFPKKQVATALGAYRVLRVYRMGCQQLLGLLGNRQKGFKDRIGSAGRNSCWEV